jgi:hypothetical protein
LLRPYGLTGAFFSLSVIGILSGSPYTAHVLENTNRLTFASRIAWSTLTVVATLFW